MDAIIRGATLLPEARLLRRARPAPSAPAGCDGPAAVPDSAAGERLALLEAERADWLAQAQAEQAASRALTEQLQGAAIAEAAARGFADGQARGEQAGRAVLQAEVERVASVASRVLQAKADVLEQAEDALVEIILAATQRIIGAHAGRRDEVVACLRHVLADVRVQSELLLCVHPDDLSLLAPGTDGVVAGFDQRVRFQADAEVGLGGCVVHSEAGSLDARLETQLARLQARLLAVRAERRGGGAVA